MIRFELNRYFKSKHFKTTNSHTHTILWLNYFYSICNIRYVEQIQRFWTIFIRLSYREKIYRIVYFCKQCPRNIYCFKLSFKRKRSSYKKISSNYWEETVVRVIRISNYRNLN